MKLHLIPRLISCLLLLLFGILHLAGPLIAAQYEENVSTENYLFAKGIIHSVSLDTKTIRIKTKKGPTIVLVINKDTLFEGFYKLEDLKPREAVKVWYRPGEIENKTLKILKPLELGC